MMKDLQVLNLSMHCSDVLLFFITFRCLCEVLLHLKFRRTTQAFDKTMLVIMAVYQRCPAMMLLSLRLKLQSPVRK